MSDNNKQDKVFAEGVWIRQKNFDNGGHILKVGVAVDRLTEFLKKHKKENGYVDLVISEKRVPDENSSHTCTLDTWQPNGSTKSTSAPKTAPAKKSTVKKSEPAPETDGNDF